MCAIRSWQKTADDFEEGAMIVEPFALALSKNSLNLTRGQTRTLQINVGLFCNQTCKHCHLEAGPHRKEMMTSETVDEVVAFAQRGHFETIDITGGAPELNPNLVLLINKLSPLGPRIILRSNLTALTDGKRDLLIGLCKVHRVVILASLPSLNEGETESQRGEGVFQWCINALKKLNSIGYGQDGSGLEIDLVTNPTGAFLPSPQGQAEKRFHLDLQKKWGIVFNHLYTFTNVPLGRFRHWLFHSGSFASYTQKLAASFNPRAFEGLMCRSLISVSWDGYLHDCDFNLAKGLFMDGRKRHISEMDGPPPPGTSIAVSDHCYACTAGPGFA
jgi:radical SAM/Cys-rich protein